MKVLLSGGEDRVTVSATGGYSVGTENGGFRLSNSPFAETNFVLSKNKWLFIFDHRGKKVGNLREPVFVATQDPRERIVWGHRQFRGRLKIFVSRDGQLAVVNDLEIEDYLRGVVAAEMGEFGEREHQALKAMAIAARSYSIRKILDGGNSEFDLLATEDDQVYKGYGSETPACDRAVGETKGLVALYQGRVINAFYHSTCGGRTEDAGNVWSEDGSPYLRSVEDSFDGNSFFCQDSPDFRWIEEWDGSVIEHMFQKALDSLSIGQSFDAPDTLEDIQVVERFKSGRVRKLRVKLGPNLYSFYGDSIRRILKRSAAGGAKLRSTLFALRLVRDGTGKIEKMIAIGGGNGHGVGLCQWGAVGMARKGFNYETILKHYYQGIELRRIY